MKLTILFVHILLLIYSSFAQATSEIRLITYNSFNLPKKLIQQFEKNNNTTIKIIKAGDNNTLINRLILTKDHPIADVVYGINNNNIYKIIDNNLIQNNQPILNNDIFINLKNISVINYGFIALNYDKEWFTTHKLPLPKNLYDLALPQYKDLLVVENPNTSAVGMAFLLANIAGIGEKNTFNWWLKMRQNGIKITKDWSEAYYKEFTLNGGHYPIMVGYTSSPAAEIFYSKNKLVTPNINNLFLQGAVYEQVEGAAILNQTKQPQLAKKLIQFLQSVDVQNSLVTTMWVYPANKKVLLPKIMQYATLPKMHWAPNPQRIQKYQQNWLERWNQIVLH